MRAALLLAGLLLVGVTAPAGAHLGHVTGTPQVTPDGTVTVEKAFVAQAVWLVLHADDGGDKGDPIGHTLLDPSDAMRDVPVELSPGAWTNTDGARTVHVDLYYDDGDGTFDAAEDRSMAETGPFSTVSFEIRPGDSRAYVGVEGFDTQRTTGSVVVRRVVLPGDGHLVIHNVSRGSTAEVVGHESLAAGEHEDVAVALDEAFYERRPFSFSLRATVYVDDGDGRLDGDDRPVRVGDETVHSGFRVSKQDPDATPTREESDLVVTPTRTASEEPGPPDGDGSLGLSAWPGGALVAAVLAIVAIMIGGWYRLRE